MGDDVGQTLTALTGHEPAVVEQALTRVGQRVNVDRLAWCTGDPAVVAVVNAGDLVTPVLVEHELGQADLALAAELRHTALADVVTLGFVSRMGVALEFAPGVGDVRALLDGYAQLAGLGSVPDSLAPVWLEFASGRAQLSYGGNPLQGHFEFTAKVRGGRIVSPVDLK